MEAYDEGIELLEAATKELRGTSSDAVPFNVLWKLYLGKGDLNELQRLVQTIQTTVPERLNRGELDPRTRKSYENMLVFTGFRKGYVEFSRGDIPAARESFRAHIAELGEREAKAPLHPAWRVFRERSVANLAFLEERRGRPAPDDLDLGSGWVTEKRLPLSAARGKIVALVFRRVGDGRSLPFVEQISEFCGAEPAREMLVVSYLDSRESTQDQAGAMRAELSGVRYTGAAGFDPGRRRALALPQVPRGGRFGHVSDRRP